VNVGIGNGYGFIIWFLCWSLLKFCFWYSYSNSHLASSGACGTSSLSSGARVELTSVVRHERELTGFPGGGAPIPADPSDRQQQLLPPSHLDRNLATMLASRGAAKLADTRSTGRLATHRRVMTCPSLVKQQLKTG
jgi:hypothetical protein